MSKFSSYNEELGINCIDDSEVYAVREKMKDYIPSLEDEYLDKFVIVKSKLLYVGTDEKELEIANRLGIGGGGEGSDAGATVKEIQSIVDGVIELKDSFENQLPTNDTDKLDSLENTNSNKGIIGTRLFDRSDLNLVNGTWNILIEYDRENKETARYGTGYYWLQKGKEYTIGEETLNFKNDYIIDYKNKEFIVLSGRAVNWNVNATLGVNKNIALNLDPMSLANGEWRDTQILDDVSKENFFDFIVKNTDGTEVNTGIQKTGDVEYDKTNKALKFNKNEEKNQNGEKGYIVLSKDNVDFSNGITFEFYGNFDRLRFSSTGSNRAAFGIFSRCPMDFSSYFNQMRFGWASNNCLLDLRTPNTGICENDENNNLYGIRAGGYGARELGFDVDEDAYMSIVYVVYDKELSKKYQENHKDSFENGDGNFDELMDEQYKKYENEESDDYYDKLLYYVNGENFGYTHCSHKDYVDGGKSGWNTDDYIFHVGVSAWHSSSNIYYMKGLCYAARLYVDSLTPDEVKLNYDMTLKYRDSFKDE